MKNILFLIGVVFFLVLSIKGKGKKNKNNVPDFKNIGDNKETEEKKTIFDNWTDVFQDVCNEDRTGRRQSERCDFEIDNNKEKKSLFSQEKSKKTEEKTKEKLEKTKQKNMGESKDKFDLRKAVIYSSILERPYK
jgi:hypothetical protein